MSVLVDIGHPGHVHLFKYFISKMEDDGIPVAVTARDKDVIIDLLKHYEIPYRMRGHMRPSMFRKAIDMPLIDLKVAKIMKAKNVSCALGVLNPYIAQAAFFTGRTAFTFTDTEHAKLANRITIPFSKHILTPQCYTKSLGKKQKRYAGYHELAYLHPNRFKPDNTVLDEIGISKDEKFAIVRFVSWGASHDTGQFGFTDSEKIELIEKIKPHARPIITSEGKMPKEIEEYKIRIAPHRIHDAMHYASLYVGEGGTMANEASILGTPSVFVSTLARTCGVFLELAEKYNLIELIEKPAESIPLVESILEDKSYAKKMEAGREKMLSENIDVTGFIIDYVREHGL